VTSGRRRLGGRLGAAVWTREHLGAGRWGAGRLGAVLIKNRHSASVSWIIEKNHSITELDAKFMLIKYFPLSEIEAGLVQGIISMLH